MMLQGPSASVSLFDVLERVLDKGIVVDPSVHVPCGGLEVLPIDAWVVVASFETYLRHDDAMRKISSGEVMQDPRVEPHP